MKLPYMYTITTAGFTHTVFGPRELSLDEMAAINKAASSENYMKDLPSDFLHAGDGELGYPDTLLRSFIAEIEAIDFLPDDQELRDMRRARRNVNYEPADIHPWMQKMFSVKIDGTTCDVLCAPFPVFEAIFNATLKRIGSVKTKAKELAMYNPDPQNPPRLKKSVTQEIFVSLMSEEQRLMKIIQACLDGSEVRHGALGDYAEASNEIGKIRTMIRLFP